MLLAVPIGLVSQLQTPCPALDLVLTAPIGFDLPSSNMKSARNRWPNSSVTDLLRSPNSLKALSQTIIETVQQTRHCLFRFVAHIGEAEGFALNFAVAGIDHEMMFSAQFFRQFQNVDASIVTDTSKRFRPESFLGKEIETGSFHPIAYERIGAGMSIEARFESFLENFGELGLQRVNMRDAWGARRHPFFLLFFELEKIEIEAAVRNFLGSRESLFGN